MLFYNNTDGFGKGNSETLSEHAKVCLDKPVAELGLSVRSANVLKAAEISQKVGDGKTRY